jgi:hypothetical protein
MKRPPSSLHHRTVTTVVAHARCKAKGPSLEGVATAVARALHSKGPFRECGGSGNGYMQRPSTNGQNYNRLTWV